MRYLLDTNIVSHLVRKEAVIFQRLERVIAEGICISVVTEAEILAGLAKKPKATRLATTMHSFLAHTDILVWDSQVAKSYADLQLYFIEYGRALSTMDALITAHAHAVGATLVTADKAFLQLNDFVPVEDWTIPL
ncbi:MAG: VapC toxin family PIN domain ribonuclease [Gammaproteobacteria bacterium]|nr:MAG: VapC toxin family PIN domain ribonuclease [Gammaproteobacteria bacterium]